MIDLKLELRAIRAIVGWMEKMDDGARQRILSYLVARWGVGDPGAPVVVQK